MMISVSNILWQNGKSDFETLCEELSKNETKAIELALSCIFREPSEITYKDVLWLKDLLNKYNLEVSALHSLTFTRGDLVLFDSCAKRQELVEYIKRYIDLSRLFDCKNIVFGSPKSRLMYGKTKTECDDIFVDFLLNLDNYLDGINFNIEPLNNGYCEYLNTYEEAVLLLSDIKLNNCFVQLDTRSIIESNEDIDALFLLKQKIKHVHLGNPCLKRLGDTFIQKHKKIAHYLKDIQYRGFLTLEVLYDEKLKLSRKDFLRRIITEAKHIYEI